MRHILTAEISKTEQRSGSHYGEWTNYYYNLVCPKCGIVKKDVFQTNVNNINFTNQIEIEHNLDKLFELLEGVQKIIHLSGIKRFIKLK